jgi:putative redox protein
MKSKINWTHHLQFETDIRGHKQILDTTAPLSVDQGPSPKEMVLAAVSGCTGMDVASMMKKHKQDILSFSVEAEADLTKEHPKVFTHIHLTYILNGQNLDLEKIKSSVDLSMNQYCGVSAMLAKACPVYFKVMVNSELIHQGEAHKNH